MQLRARVAQTLFIASVCFAVPGKADDAAPQASYADASRGTVLLNMEGKQYVVDVAAGTVRLAASQASAVSGNTSAPGADLFRQNCATCHRADGRGIAQEHTPDLTGAAVHGMRTGHCRDHSQRQGGKHAGVVGQTDGRSDRHARAVR